MATDFTIGLVSSWEYEETSGLIFADDMGTNPLTISGVGLAAAGIIGNCGNWDGVNDNAKIAHASQVGLNIATGSFTINTWFKSSNFGGGTKFMVAKTLNTGGPGYTILNGEGAIEGDINDGTTVKRVIGALGFDNSAWHMVTQVVDRTAQLLHLYVDAVSQGSVGISAVGSLSNTQAFAIGSASNNLGFYQGFIDQTAFWNGRALTAPEVFELYNGGSGIPFSLFQPDPIPTSITPNTGSNVSNVEIADLAGTNLTGVIGVKLKRAGQPDIVASSFTVVSDTKITCFFDLLGAVPGFWNVNLTSSMSSGTLPLGFSITQANVNNRLQDLIGSPDGSTPHSRRSESDVSDRKSREFTPNGL